MSRLLGLELIESRKRRYVGLVVVFVMLAAGVAWAALPNGSSIWIDEPLDGSSMELGSVVVIGHVSDLAGIESARLEVDGIEVAASDATTGAGSLATLQFGWTPDASGTKVLALWAKSTGGEWFGPAFATVFVVGDPVTTTTASTGTTPTTSPPSTTPSTTTTTTTTVPTTTCTAFGVPELTNPANNAVIEKTGDTASITFNWSYEGCQPGDLLFHIQLADHPGFGSGTIIWNTTTGNLDETSTPIACADYWWRVRVRAPVVGEWSLVRSFILQGNCP